MIIETCPECGAPIMNTVLSSYPPIPEKTCTKCGWRWTGEREPIEYRPFEPPAKVIDLHRRSFDETVNYLKKRITEDEKHITRNEMLGMIIALKIQHDFEIRVLIEDIRGRHR